MWHKSIGLIIFFKIACVVIGGDNAFADSRSSNVDQLVEKKYELILSEVTWFTADHLCKENEMQLASIASLEEQQQLERLFKDENMYEEHFWISAIRHEEGTSNKNRKPISEWNPTNQCTFWYWYRVELCIALWPVANKWIYHNCDERKYFICERVPRKEESMLVLAKKKMLKMIRDELVKLVDEMMLSGFAGSLPTTTEDTWFHLVKGALSLWLNERQQVSKPKSYLDDKVILLAEQVAKMTKSLETKELRRFVHIKFDMLKREERLTLLSERFRTLLADEYLQLLEDAPESTAKKSDESLTDEMIKVLVKKVILLVKAKQDKIVTDLLDKADVVEQYGTLDEELMKKLGVDLVKLSDEEFKTYVFDAVDQFEGWSVEEADMDILLHLFLLVKQELFTLVAKSSIKSTFKVQIDITNYGLSRILRENVLKVTGERSVFGQIFVALATGIAVLEEEKFVKLDDEVIREFVRNEFDGLTFEDLVELKYDGYIRFIVDEFIKLSLEPESVKNESGELLIKKIIDSLASQLFWFGDDEMERTAERLIKERAEKSTEHILQIMAESANRGLYMYEEGKLPKLIQLIEQELVTITSNSLLHFSDQQMIEFAEKGLSKLLSGDASRSIKKTSVFWKIIISLEEKLSKFAKEELAKLNGDVELHKLVKLELDKLKYDGAIEFFEEAYFKLIADEFLQLTKEGTASLTAQKEGSDQFGEMVKLLGKKLFEAAQK